MRKIIMYSAFALGIAGFAVTGYAQSVGTASRAPAGTRPTANTSDDTGMRPTMNGAVRGNLSAPHGAAQGDTGINADGRTTARSGGTTLGRGGVNRGIRSGTSADTADGASRSMGR